MLLDVWESNHEKYPTDGFDRSCGNPEAIGQLSKYGEGLFDVFHMRKINQFREAMLKK
jgi:hypothetical protein